MNNFFYLDFNRRLKLYFMQGDMDVSESLKKGHKPPKFENHWFRRSLNKSETELQILLVQQIFLKNPKRPVELGNLKTCAEVKLNLFLYLFRLKK